MGYLSGKSGYVKVGAGTYSFGKWRLPMKGGAPKVTNFTSLGFQALVPGIISGTVILSGPWNVGNTPIAVGFAYVFHLGLDTGLELAVTALVTDITPENDVEGTPQVSVTAESTGPFTAAIT